MKVMMQAGCYVVVACLVGCSTMAEVDLRKDASLLPPPSPGDVEILSADLGVVATADIRPADSTHPFASDSPLVPPLPEATAVSAPEAIRCAATSSLQRTIQSDTCTMLLPPAVQEPIAGDEMRLRPPLRRLWFTHPALVPHGDGDDLSFPDSAVLAHRTRVTSRPFRDPYGGLRDQPLFHPDTSRAPARESQLPDIGPPPPKHTIKTFATLTGLSLLGIGMYALGPSSFTGANKDEDVWGEASQHFKNAWTKPPVFDKDGNGVNYVGHPYFGMNFYLSQRNYGESPLYSFLFSTFTSTCFEYFIESWSERPSIQDLIITPVVGSILGELVYRATQEMRKDGFTKAEKIIVTIINPLYVLQNGYR
jgi:hypothetical protein